MDSKLECICGLILLGLMHVQEVLEDVVHTRAGLTLMGGYSSMSDALSFLAGDFRSGKTRLQ